MALLRYAAKLDPFLSLDCAPTPSTLVQSKERRGSNFAIWQPWDQVTDMMVANSSNLIITVKPANQRTLMPRRGSFSRTSNMSHGSLLSKSSGQSAGTVGTGGSDDIEEEDEIRDLTNAKQPTASNNLESMDGGHRAGSYSTASLNSKKQVLHL